MKTILRVLIIVGCVLFASGVISLEVELWQSNMGVFSRICAGLCVLLLVPTAIRDVKNRWANTK